MSRFYNYINEEWNIKPTSSSGNALWKYRDNDAYKTIIFMYIPYIDIFAHMRSDNGIVYVNNKKVGYISDVFDRHHEDLALKILENVNIYDKNTIVELYNNGEILEKLEDDFDIVRGFVYKNNIYIYPVGGYKRFKSKSILKLKTYLDDNWWLE